MYKHETFPRAPITEALIDIRVSPPEDISFDQLEQFAAAVSERFPTKEERFYQKAGIKLEMGAPVEVIEDTREKTGFILFSESRDKAVQARRDGFTLSKLKPYESWDALRGEARELWALYRELVAPGKVVRLAARYINRIEIPLPMSDFKDYILTGPEIAPGIPQAIAEMFFRVVIPKPEIEATAIINSIMEKPTEDGTILPYILDIDVIKKIEIESASEKIWDLFEDIRNYKNDIFFNSITERAKKMFR